MSKPHSLVRIKASLVNNPLLIEQTSFNSILDYVNQRNMGDIDVTPKSFFDNDEPVGHAHRYIEETKTGVMHISGPLTYRTSGWEAFCGGTSYEMLKEQMEYFASAGAKTVAMMVDSGGGEAHGMIDSANYIRKIANENDIRIVAYVDGMSASAAYGISCVADEIVMSSDSLVGSIGVLIQLYNDSKALEKEGYERTFITAGADKVPYAKDGSFTDSFIDGLQEQVDTLYESFTGHVAAHRSLDISVVKGTEANVFMVNESLKLGLADKTMTVEEFYDYLADVSQNNIEGTQMGIKDVLKFNRDKEEIEMAQLEDLKVLLEVEQTSRATAEASLVTMSAQIKESAAAIATLTEQLGAFKEAQAVAEKAAADAVLAARTAALADVVPTAEVDNYLVNMSSMDEGAFTFMVGQLKAVKETRAEGFRAVGGEGAEEETQQSTIDVIREAGVKAAQARR